MNKLVMIIVFLTSLLTYNKPAAAQAEEAEQLLLNVEKLAQLKQILSNLKKGYEIVSTGYNSIIDISEGNFNLHQVFLDGLLEVSPAVKNYKKVADIIHYQLLIVKEYKNAFNRFNRDNHFTAQEISYMGKLYAGLFNQSLKNIDALVTVITAGQLRMSDDERLGAIDAIFNDMQDKLQFLRSFNNSTLILAIQRARENKDVSTLQKIYGITN